MSADLKTFSLTEYEANIGGDGLNEFINSFSCPINPEVEKFLKQKAVASARLSSSQTYLVCSDTTGELLGYYTLVLKSYSVNGSILNSKNRRLISRFAEEDESGNFTAAVYLIAQIGKNFAVPEKERVTGDDLIANALDEFRSIKKRVGGKLVMIERESDCLRPTHQNFLLPADADENEILTRRKCFSSQQPASSSQSGRARRET